MKRAALTALLAAALLPAAVAAATGASLHPTLRGTCTTVNRLDSNAVLMSSTVTCHTSTVCLCNGRKTQLVYDSKWTSAGNGGSGPERGTLVATDKSDTVTLRLTGKRDGTGAGSGSWVLTKASGQPKSRFRSHGTYTSLTSQIGSGLGATQSVKVTAAIGCWSC